VNSRIGTCGPAPADRRPPHLARTFVGPSGIPGAVIYEGGVVPGENVIWRGLDGTDIHPMGLDANDHDSNGQRRQSDRMLGRRAATT